MWKRIGIKTDNQRNPIPRVESPKGNSFQRIRPLDEKSLVEKDSSFSKNSVSSSKMSSGRGGANYMEISVSRTQTPKLLVTAPNDEQFLMTQQMYTPKNRDLRQLDNNNSHGSLPRYFPVSPQSRSPLRSGRVSETLPETQSPRASSSSLHDSLQYPLPTNDPLIQTYIESLQAKLSQSEKRNKIYKTKLKELKGFVMATRREVSKQIGGFRAALKSVTECMGKPLTKINSTQIQNNDIDIVVVKTLPLSRPVEQDAEYKQQIENVMLKIEDLRHDVQNTAVFKQEIFNRIDMNLRRIESMKNMRKGLMHR